MLPSSSRRPCGRGLKRSWSRHAWRAWRSTGDQVTVSLEGSRTLTAEKMLVAVERQPNTAGIGLETVGVAVDERGYILVNERLETSVPGIYAIGDVTGGFLLAHVASLRGPGGGGQHPGR